MTTVLIIYILSRLIVYFVCKKEPEDDILPTREEAPPIEQQPKEDKAVEGESRINQILTDLQVEFVSNPLLPRSEASSVEFDHIVFLGDSALIIETKNWRGPIYCSKDKNWRTPTKKSTWEWNPYRQIDRMKKSLEKLFDENGIPAGLTVYAYICFVDGKRTIYQKDSDFVLDGEQELETLLGRLIEKHSNQLSLSSKQAKALVERLDMSDDPEKVEEHLARGREASEENVAKFRKVKDEEAKQRKYQEENGLEMAIEEFIAVHYRKNSKTKRKDYFKKVSNFEVHQLKVALDKHKESKKP